MNAKIKLGSKNGLVFQNYEISLDIGNKLNYLISYNLGFSVVIRLGSFNIYIELSFLENIIHTYLLIYY